MSLRSFGSSLLLLAATASVAVAQPPIAAQIAARHPMPKTGTRSPLVLRSDVKGTGEGNVPNPSLINSFDSVVDGINTNGIARLSIFVTPTSGFSCTGALIAPTVMLTAAHCVTDDLTGALVTTDDQVRSRFLGPGNTNVDIWSTHIAVRPEWHGFANPLSNGGNDVALIFLSEAAAPWMTQYSIFAGDPYDPWFQDVDFAGYGEYGNGFQGAQGFDGQRRWGQNRVEYISDFNFDSNDPGILWTDFDSGRSKNDAFCWATGGGAGNPFCDNGRGKTEFGLGHGDSGGPLFLNGQVAGVASFGTYFCGTDGCAPAVPPLAFGNVPAGWGSLNGYANVAYNADWIESQIALHAFAPTVSTPEPSSLVLTLGGLVALVGVVRRKRMA